MHPVLLKIGPVLIYSYGVMVAAGFGFSTLLIYKRAFKFGIDKDRIIDLAILTLLSGVVGARFLYVLLNIDYYISSPLEVFNLSKGGLVWYGGFLSGLAASLWYLKHRRLSFWNFADLMAPYIALAQSIGRIGCFLNGCCFGITSSEEIPFGVVFAGGSAQHHPTQVYSSLSLLLIFAVLRIWQDRRRFSGEIFLGYCMLYSSKRFILEFLRGDNSRMALGLTMSQLMSASILLAAFILFVHRLFTWKRATSR